VNTTPLHDPHPIVPWDSIIRHLFGAEFIVTKPLFIDSKEQEQTESGEGCSVSVRPGFRFTADNVTLRPGSLENGSDDIDFFIEVFVPREWWHYPLMPDLDVNVTSGGSDGFDRLGMDICISSFDLADRCDEAPEEH
jgi:hypothetical protein